ncbi:MAG: dTMP kinase [Erysipelotrichaceae bacterium]|jgi:dTMP kinase|nr:dTMP kinase [Erysipelotrichaceae bacterium]
MFITLEGPEGSGKTSATKNVVKKLIELGYDVVQTREPGGTPIAEKIRGIILDKSNGELDPRAEALLFAASRRQHLVEKVWPALEKGKIVICDRYLDSSLAYQGGARGLGVENVLNINLFATEGTYPDLTLLFDINPVIGLERINKNANREVNRLDLEKIEFHNKVRETFLSLANRWPERYVIIDASKPIEEVEKDVYKIVMEKINGSRKIS